jgi:rSAM/selenodomain-associated transferase 1
MGPGAPPPERLAPREVRIAVFARAPVAGQAKTRLAPLLGAEGAAMLQADLVLRTLATATASAVGPVELWCSPDASHPFFARCAAELGVRLREQRGRDLGERMSAAFDAALGENAALVVIGSDCPALTPAVLREAAQALEAHDAVIAPAEDGGYVLVGLSRPDPGLFTGVAWGGSTVMAETRARLARGGRQWKELGTFWDIDRPEDYARLEREGGLRSA